MHKSVLLDESIEGLNIRQGSIVVDATLGGGGHSNRILQIIGKKGKLIAIDQDLEAIENFKKQSGEDRSNVYCVKDNFSNLKNILQELEIEFVDAILADLGYSSIQLEDASRGMSFLADAPLDMRLDRQKELKAGDIVNNYSQGEIKRILKDYGEERFAGIIAKKIADHRKIKEIETTGELVEIIRQAVPQKHQHGKIHVATKTFQALRIEINRELEVLEEFIPCAMDSLKKTGRLAIISFHSLEDRIVKNIFRKNARGCICPPDFPICQCGQAAKVKIITKKPIVPGEMEVSENPRARSAKLRICEKI
ncbi:MAG: Ribosomal RNA small subunit methyltransferase H [uncultured bacterium]|nr:MAG: Ribosomal RNA small subunit methyltransferase H [uncultured bacterium]